MIKLQPDHFSFLSRSPGSQHDQQYPACACAYVCVCVCVCMIVCVRVCMCVCMCVYECVYVCISVCVYECLCAYVFVCVGTNYSSSKGFCDEIAIASINQSAIHLTNLLITHYLHHYERIMCTHVISNTVRKNSDIQITIKQVR